MVLRETKLSSVMTRQVAEAICLEHDTRADGTLDYAALCDDIFPGDFDHFAHQQHFVYKVCMHVFTSGFVWRRPLFCSVFYVSLQFGVCSVSGGGLYAQCSIVFVFSAVMSFFVCLLLY